MNIDYLSNQLESNMEYSVILVCHIEILYTLQPKRVSINGRIIDLSFEANYN